MRTLDNKLFRNLISMKGQVLAIVLIIACGVASYVSVVTAYRGLKGSRDSYYRRFRMADLWAGVKRAPRRVTRDLEKIEGVRGVQGRIRFGVTLDLSGVRLPISASVISVPDRRSRILNDLHLLAGRWFTGDGTREVIVADRFCRAHGLKVNDTISVLMNNRKQALRIVAIAQSPEFIYLIGGGSILPDDQNFTVLWMSRTFAESVFDFKDACNEFVATLDPEAVLPEVIARFDARLDRYGARGAIARKDQISNRMISDEIKGLEGTATFLPALFLGVAAFVLRILMGRLVQTQRTQIALLRAFGYSTRELVAHFWKFTMIVALGGALVGTGLGLWFAHGMVSMYKEFYSFPVLEFGADPVAVPTGIFVSLLFALLGTFGALRAVARLDPAEGMRAESPAIYRRTLFERFAPLWRRLSSTTRMILRHLARTKLRSAVTAVGIALATSILVVAFFAVDATAELMDIQFRLVERQEVRVAFHKEHGRAALHEMRRLDGVRTAEGELGVAVRLRNGWRSRRTAITGLESGQQLHALLDADLNEVSLPRGGLLLTTKLADLLAVGVGDLVEVEVLTGRKPRFLAPVEKVVKEYLGTAAYAEIGWLSRRLKEEYVLTGALLSIDTDRAGELGLQLKSLPAVAAVSFKSQMISSFRDTIAESQGIMNRTLVLFAGVIIFGVLYNAARISLSERERELGSLRVLGYTNREISVMLAGENLLLVGLGLAPGLGLGAFFSWLLSVVYDTDLFRFPFVLRPDSLLTTILVVSFFGAIANLLVLRRVRKLDVVAVLKARE